MSKKNKNKKKRKSLSKQKKKRHKRITKNKRKREALMWFSATFKYRPAVYNKDNDRRLVYDAFIISGAKVERYGRPTYVYEAYVPEVNQIITYNEQTLFFVRPITKNLILEKTYRKNASKMGYENTIRL